MNTVSEKQTKQHRATLGGAQTSAQADAVIRNIDLTPNGDDEICLLDVDDELFDYEDVTVPKELDEWLVAQETKEPTWRQIEYLKEELRLRRQLADLH